MEQSRPRVRGILVARESMHPRISDTFAEARKGASRRLRRSVFCGEPPLPFPDYVVPAAHRFGDELPCHVDLALFQAKAGICAVDGGERLSACM